MNQSNDTAEVESFTAYDMKVHSGGKVTLPANKRGRHDAESGAVVDAEAVTDGGNEFSLAGRNVDSRGRITIPSRQRGKYGIEDGDYVSMVVTVTTESD